MLFFKQPYRTHFKPFHKYGANLAQSRKQKTKETNAIIYALFSRIGDLIIYMDK